MTNIAAIQIIPLERAFLCVSCNIISDDDRCPCCASEQIWPVQAWLDRVEVSVGVE